MDTKTFKTRTIFCQRSNPIRKDDVWVSALDMGYSAVKVMSQNVIACFPSYARKLAKNAISLVKPLDTDILYRDCENGDIYAVGAKAESMISVETTNDNNATLYGRNRYFGEIFQVTSKVGLAMSMMSNQFGSPEGKRIIVQTGLPCGYIVDDAPLLREALSGHFDFDIKIGAGPWQHFEFQLDQSDIFIMQQPMGTLISLATDKDGNPTPDSEKLLSSRVLVFDPGFRTGDTTYIKGGSIDMENDCHTFTNFSMIEVLSRTVDVLKKNPGVNVSVPAMQECLKNGYVKAVDKIHFKSTQIEFADILEKQSRTVCDEAINKLAEIYNYFTEVDYLALTGGTGAAWSNYIREKLKGFEENLTILSGNRNDELPHIFSNVRGYYMYRINRV